MKIDKDHLDVSQDDIILAADALQGDGKPVTIEAVRDIVGAGSVTAIHKHLAAWRAEHAAPAPAASPELPPELLAGLTSWARQFADAAGAGMRQALASFESDMQTLLRAGEELAAAHTQAQLLAAERDAEIERLKAELRNARQVAADALVGKARDHLAIDGKDAQLAELRQQLERNVAMTAAESDARLEAQMELVGIKTERDNLAIEVRELRAQLDTSRVERGNLRAELEVLRGRSQ